MNVTGALVLASDVLVIRVSDLPEAVREELADDGAFAVTRARGRAPSVLIDEDAAELLGGFQEPTTIVEAVLRFSRRRGADPETVLAGAYPALRRFRSAGYLLGADEAEGHEHRITFAVGEPVAGGRVIRCVRVLADTEIYQLALDGGGLAALKVLKPDLIGVLGDGFRREAATLSVIGGRVAPRLLRSGEAKGNPWLCLEWCDGVPVSTAAAGLRRSRAGDPALLALAHATVSAVADLHELGVVHGDLHPGNILASPTGEVRLIDFGLARPMKGSRAVEPVPRGGVQAFLDPQYARSLRDGTITPQASAASDLYSLGAVVYQIVTGSTYLEFSIDRAEMLRQLVEDPPLPFTLQGRPPWPDLEDCLSAALAKEPGDRPASVAEFGRRLAAVATSVPAAKRRRRELATSDAVLDEVIRNAQPGGAWFDQGIPASPLCSVAYGAAGVAAALRRVAVLRSDSELATLADEWVVRAARESGSPEAFDSAELALHPSRTGQVSPFHRLSGVHAVQALVSSTLGDAFASRQAVAAFVAQSRHPCRNLDLTLGRSGTLLACALLMEAGADPGEDPAELIALGEQTLTGIWQEIDAMAPIAEGTPLPHLGVAHGWAGVLLATLRWCRVASLPLPSGMRDRLDQMAALASPAGLGLRWPWMLDPSRADTGRTMPGWCNGSAGFVHLWTTAHTVLGDQRWEGLAVRAAWDTYLTPTKITQLCCGLAGQAYALLALYQYSGDAQWLTLATELGTRAAHDICGHDTTAASLHKGALGVATLAADLAEPEAAAMPFFGVER